MDSAADSRVGEFVYGKIVEIQVVLTFYLKICFQIRKIHIRRRLPLKKTTSNFLDKFQDKGEVRNRGKNCKSDFQPDFTETTEITFTHNRAFISVDL